jgi:hypothetical protein
MPDNVAITPGMRVLCRDAEWLVTRVDPSDYANQHYAVHCIGADDLVRGHESIFLTQLDRIDPVDPRNTQLMADSSSGYRLSKLFLEAQLRQMPATGIEPDLMGMGAFKPMRFKEDVREEAGENLTDRQLVPLAQTTVDATPGEEAVYGVLAKMREAATGGKLLGEGARAGRIHALIQYGGRGQPGAPADPEAEAREGRGPHTPPRRAAPANVERAPPRVA